MKPERFVLDEMISMLEELYDYMDFIMYEDFKLDVKILKKKMKKMIVKLKKGETDKIFEDSFINRYYDE